MRQWKQYIMCYIFTIVVYSDIDINAHSTETHFSIKKWYIQSFFIALKRHCNFQKYVLLMLFFEIDIPFHLSIFR